MSYVKTTWVDDTTPINASNLNKIENGIYNNDERIANITGEILWSDTNFGDSFEAQTITLSSSDYDMLEVIYTAAYNIPNYDSVRFLKGQGALMTNLSISASSLTAFTRGIVYDSATSLRFGSGFTRSSAGNNQNDGVCIPVYVIGYKTELFS